MGTKHRRIYLKVKSTHFSEPQNMFLRGVMKTTFGATQAPNGHSPEQPGLANPALNNGVGGDDL